MFPVIVATIYCSLAVVYVIFGIQNRRFTKCLLKCLPILFLIFSAVVLSAVETTGFSEAARTRRMLLLLALILSCIGDGCLVFHKVFVFGVVSFAVSLLLYINTLEITDSLAYMSVEGVLAGICILFLGILISITIKVMTSRSSKFPSVPKLIIALILSYYFILSMLLWAGLMLFFRRKDHLGAGAAVGVIIFYISDLLIAASAFWDLRLLRGRGLIMLTYYAAQLFLMLSIFYM